jgi:hypothetical protein
MRATHNPDDQAKRVSKGRDAMTETGEMADDPKRAPEARRHLARLRDLAGRLDHQAALIRNGEGDPRAEARQTLNAIGGAGITTRSRP